MGQLRVEVRAWWKRGVCSQLEVSIESAWFQEKPLDCYRRKELTTQTPGMP